MAGLLTIMDLLALRGSMEARQISLQLKMPQPLINAMLQQLEVMGKVRQRTEQSSSDCLSGSCKGCPTAISACQHERWQLC